MTDNIFDKFVSDKLRDHPSAVPPGLWEKIEHKKDRDRGGAFWLPRAVIWAGLFVILTGLGVGYYLLQQDENATATQPSSQASAAKTPGTPNNSNTPFASGGSTNNNIQENKNQSTDDKEEAATATTATEKNNSKRTSTAVIPGEKTTLAERKQMRHHQRKHTTITNVVSDDANTPVRNDLVTGKKFNSGTPGRNKKHPKTAAAYNTVSVIGVNATDENSPTSETVRPPFAKGFTAMNAMNLKPTAKTQFNLSEIRLYGIDCPTAGRPRRNDWYLEVYGSPDKAFKSVSGSAAYVNKKDSTESTQLGYTAGFRISKSITDNILLKTGVQFSQINERFDLRTENERRIITVVTIRPITLPNGTDSSIRDTTTVEQIGYTLRRTYNRYRSLDIPVLMSYEFGGERLKFAVNAGVILNLRSWYSGESLNDSLAVVSLNSKSNSLYKQNIGLGIYAGFSIMTPVARQTELFFEPYFRYNLSNMSNGGFTQKFNAAGLSIGLRYKLNGQRKPGL